MSTSTHPATSGGLVQIAPNDQPNGRTLDTATLEELIRERVSAERARLEQAAGVVHKEIHHFHKPIERPFTAEQRGKTTLLFGGLTWKHEKLVHGALEGLGYKLSLIHI